MHEDRLGVLNFLRPGEPPASALATAAAAAADGADADGGAAAAEGFGGGAAARKVWDASKAAPKPALKHNSIGGAVSVNLFAKVD